jgi:hypothetical protein
MASPGSPPTKVRFDSFELNATSGELRKHRGNRLRTVIVMMLSASLLAAGAYAQKASGSIEGTISDPTGAVVPNVRITATNETTGEDLVTLSNQSGLYRLLEMNPASYSVIVEAQGFKQIMEAHVLVLISRVTPLNFTLTPGSISEQVVVSSGPLNLDSVSTESGEVINREQIEQLPIVGRNMMDLAQLSPGVQLRDGNDIDPTKNNFTIAAFQGRSGRETQIQLDGMSIQDHTVGGPVQNVGLDAVQEFQVAQSTLNPAQSVASGGAINILTRSGGNQVHGSAFEFFRDSRLGARIGPVSSPYDRSQLGGSLGGAFRPNRLFYFVDYELTGSRDSFYANTIFPSLNGFFAKPFREHFVVGRLDGAISDKWKAFARYSYSPNRGVVGSPQLGVSFIDSLVNKTQSIVYGGNATYAGAHVTHSFSYGFNSYSQQLVSNPQAPAPEDIAGRKYFINIDHGSTLAYGVNPLSSQFQKQHNYEAKYDGDIQIGRHTLAFGIDVTHWILGTDFPLMLSGPGLLSFSYLDTAADPTQYPLAAVAMSNGLGYFTVPGALGFPHGAWPEWRPAAYIHDVWKAGRNLTLNAGLRYVFFSGQFAPDINHPLLLNSFEPGLSGYRHAPKTNFAPQIGAAWDIGGKGKTVLRSAAGLYFEELTIDGIAGDTGNFIPAGISSQSQFILPGAPLIDPRSGVAFAAGDPLAMQYGFPNGTAGPALNPLFAESIGQAATAVNNLNQLYIAASAQNTSPASSFDLNQALYAPAWPIGTKNPRVAQFNVAIERQLSANLVFTGEYVFVHGYEFPLAEDENHIGAANPASFDASAAVAAISAANTSVDCPAGPAGIDCAIGNGATIATYGAYGLGAGTAATGYAFRGANPAFGNMFFYVHKAMNTYNGLNLRLDGRFGEPGNPLFRWMNGNSVTFAYTLSRNLGNLSASNYAADIAASGLGWDSLQPNRFVGPDGLDRTSMLNAGTITEIKKGFVFSQITHWYSPLADNPLIPTSFQACGGGPEEIFCSDWTGDGTTGDLLPTAGPGAFGRSLKGARGLNRAITKYNTSFAGQPTPAGKLVLGQGLMTGSQLEQLGGVMPVLPLAPFNQVGLDLLLLTDVRLAWNCKVAGDRLTISPSWDVFNVFNRSSYDPPANLLNGNLTGQQDSINGTTKANRTNIRQRGSGTFEQGARRQMQAGLRISF